MSGFIYLLSHEVMPNLLKIGFTTRTVKERVQELSSTGVPGKFTIELYFEVDNAPLFENLLHKSLNEYRFEKEFFKIDLKTAIEVIHILIKDQYLTLNDFKGRSAHLATTKEQIQARNKLEQERNQKVKDRALELKNNYLDISADCLKATLTVNYSNYSDYERTEILEIISLKRKEERDIPEQKIAAAVNFFELHLKEEFINISITVNNLLIGYIKPKFLLSLRGYSINDGQKIAKSLTGKEKYLFISLHSMIIKLEDDDILGFAIQQLRSCIDLDNNHLFFESLHRPDTLTKLLQGIFQELNLKIHQRLK